HSRQIADRQRRIADEPEQHNAHHHQRRRDGPLNEEFGNTAAMFVVSLRGHYVIKESLSIGHSLSLWERVRVRAYRGNYFIFSVIRLSPHPGPLPKGEGAKAIHATAGCRALRLRCTHS